MRPYCCLLFDADNTLLDFNTAEREALRSCLLSRGLEAGTERIGRYHAINDSYWKKLERGEIGRAELLVERFRTYFEEIGYPGDPARMQADYANALGTREDLMPHALEVVRQLAGYYPLYLVTNGNAQTQHGRLDRNPIRPYFRGVYISEELGADKPSPLFFARAFAGIREDLPQFDPQRALLIGDSLTSDIRGAASCGVATCHFCPGAAATEADYLVRDLRELLTLLEVS